MKSILLIGLNNFGLMMAKQLHSLGHEIMAVDINEERVNCILPLVTDAQIGDSTNEAFLRSLGVNNYDVCIVTIGSDFQSSLETTSLLKELGGKLVVSRANREVQAKFLLRNGADEVIIPEKQIAEWAAIRYASNHILDYIKLDDDNAIFEVTVPDNWVGKTVGQIDIRKEYGVNIMAVKENGKMDLSVTPDTVLDANKTMLVLGEHKALQRCFKI
ncbi:MAG: TrkA family potassium uptake protein [Lachnospiraceae bacterium]|nr:TrkA family potassium uptake protein [Lachnospiraceae bacterium]